VPNDNMKTECLSKYVTVGSRIYPCTTSLVMDLIGGKWKASILYHLKDGVLRYSELRRHMPVVTEMTLSLQLKQLEKDGLLTRTVQGKKPPIRVEYRLTPFGESFVPLILQLTELGNQIVLQQGGAFIDLEKQAEAPATGN
jgi:DNA-binding HxlR family transcriptional regulator